MSYKYVRKRKLSTRMCHLWWHILDRLFIYLTLITIIAVLILMYNKYLNNKKIQLKYTKIVEESTSLPDHYPAAGISLYMMEILDESDTMHNTQYRSYLFDNPELSGKLDEINNVRYLVQNAQVNKEVTTVEETTEEIEVVEEETTVVEPDYVYEFNDTDKQMILKLTQAEAGNQGVTGAGYVMQVIADRLESEDFPDTVYEVITQYSTLDDGTKVYQFSPLDNKSYFSAVPCDDVLEAWDHFILGEYTSVMNGALYFTSQTESSTWHSRNLTYVLTYKDHKFYK